MNSAVEPIITDAVERARDLTGVDGRGLYQALVERLVPTDLAYVAGVPAYDYRCHLPTSFQVDESRGLPMVWFISTECSSDWDFRQLREVWTYCNCYPSDKPLIVRKAKKWPYLIYAPWLDEPRG